MIHENYLNLKYMIPFVNIFSIHIEVISPISLPLNSYQLVIETLRSSLKSILSLNE